MKMQINVISIGSLILCGLEPIAHGQCPQVCDGNDNTALGNGALSRNTTCFANVAVGDSTLDSNTTGGVNTAIGGDALLFNTTGSDNAAAGFDALKGNDTGVFIRLGGKRPKI